MPQELFNQTTKTTLADSDRVAAGVPSMVGAYNILFSNLAKQVNSKYIVYGTFTNADLVAGVWTLNHAKNTQYVIFFLRNPDGYEQSLAGMLRIVDANNIEIDFGGSIDSGNWSYLMLYFEP